MTAHVILPSEELNKTVTIRRTDIPEGTLFLELSDRPVPIRAFEADAQINLATMGLTKKARAQQSVIDRPRAIDYSKYAILTSNLSGARPTPHVKQSIPQLLKLKELDYLNPNPPHRSQPQDNIWEVVFGQPNLTQSERREDALIASQSSRPVMSKSLSPLIKPGEREVTKEERATVNERGRLSTREVFSTNIIFDNLIQEANSGNEAAKSQLDFIIRDSIKEANSGSTKAVYELALSYLKVDNLSEAVRYLGIAAPNGNEEARHLLIECQKKLLAAGKIY